MSKEKKTLKTLTPASLTVGLLMVLVVCLLYPQIEYHRNVHWIWGPHPITTLTNFPVNHMEGIWSAFVAPMMFLWFLPIIVTALLRKAGKGFNPAELAFIFAMIYAVPYLISNDAGVPNFLFQVHGGLRSATWHDFTMQYVPRIYSSFNLDNMELMMTGGAAVPWADWTTPIVFWALNILSYFLYNLFFGVIISRIWIDAEALPFPQGKIGTQLIKYTEPEGESKKIRLFSQFFWIGVALGFLEQLGENLNKITDFDRIIPGIDLTPNAYTYAILTFYLNFSNLGFSFILPTEILVTVPAAFIILYWIMPNILVSMGFLAPLTPGYHGWVTYNRWIRLHELTEYAPVHQGYVGFYQGIGIAACLLPFFIHRSAFARVLKNAFGGGEKSEEASLDRLSVMGMIASIIVFLGTCAWAGVPIHFAFVQFLGIALWYLVWARWNAETGATQGWGLGGFGWQSSYQWYNVQPALAMYSGNPAVAGAAQPIFTWYSHAQQSLCPNVLAVEMNSFSIGKSVNASRRDILFASIIGIVLAVVIILPYSLWLKYTIGLTGHSGLRAPAATGINFAYNVGVLSSNGWFVNSLPNEGTYAVFLFGIIFTVAMSLARARYGGIFGYISPLGILMAGSIGQGFWLPCLVALVIKMIAMRVGGLRLYNEKIVPLGIGLIMGHALLWPIMAALYGLGVIVIT